MVARAASKYVTNDENEPILMERSRQRGPSGLGPHNNSHPDLIQVNPYQKKYIHGVPGSSPVIRPADDLNYQQRFGKGPLIERAERLKRLQELKDHMNR